MDYSELKGKSKTEVNEIMGEQFNHYPFNIWTYEIGRNWLGRRKWLVVVFHQDIVRSVSFKYKW